MTRNRWIVAVALALFALAGQGMASAAEPTQTPQEMVSAYDQLADTILAAKKTEWHMVQTILATTFNHAQGTVAVIKRKIEAGKDAGPDVEKLADLVSQLGNEGDAAVAAIRKRLVEGGHHHNAKGESDGVFDEGFVIVTKAAKKVFLDAAGNIAKMAKSPSAGQLDAEWQKVAKQYQALW